MIKKIYLFIDMFQEQESFGIGIFHDHEITSAGRLLMINWKGIKNSFRYWISFYKNNPKINYRINNL